VLFRSLDAGDGVFEDDAAVGRDTEQSSRFEVDVGGGFGVDDIVAVNDVEEIGGQARFPEDEVDVVGFGVGGDGFGNGAVAIEEIAHAPDDVEVELGAHELAVDFLFGGAVGVDGVGREVATEEIADDLVVAETVHPALDAFGGNAVAFEVNLPGAIVEGSGVDDDAVEVEDKSFSGGQFSG